MFKLPSHTDSLNNQCKGNSTQTIYLKLSIFWIQYYYWSAIYIKRILCVLYSSSDLFQVKILGHIDASGCKSASYRVLLQELDPWDPAGMRSKPVPEDSTCTYSHVYKELNSMNNVKKNIFQYVPKLCLEFEILRVSF